MQILSFSEALKLRPRLSDGSIAESECDEDLLALCETVILDREIETVADAVVILQLASECVEVGPRADGRDVGAIRRVIEWLARGAPNGSTAGST